MLTETEIASLEAGLPHLQDWTPDVLVPFHARKLRNPSVVWLNDRWFLERQIDVTDAATRQRLKDWLLDEYAYVIPLENDSASDYCEATKTFFADCYGSTDISLHGGSGRAGASGRFQVKGIGRTPLVGQGIGWAHGHGCMWLEEAIREAIGAEVCANEFPHGAVPVLAVIDVGIRYRYAEEVWGERTKGAWGERRALAIRPAVARPAHLERAISFRPAGEEDDARRRDVRRVKDIVRYFEDTAPEPRDTALSGVLARTFSKIAEQVAFGRAHRLFHGDYLTSNLTMDGELLDFGAFRALPSWCRALSTNHLAGGFGDEFSMLAPSIRSIAFYMGKYKANVECRVGAAELLQDIAAEMDRAFQRECLRLFQLDAVDDEDLRREVLAALMGYYKQQQQVVARYQHGHRRPDSNWLSDGFSDCESSTGTNSPERKVLARIAGAIRSSRFDQQEKMRLCEQAWITAARLLKPRPELYRESLVGSIYGLIDGRVAPTLVAPALIEESVNAIISRNRRHWPSVPRDLVVLAQSSQSFSHILHCMNPETKEGFLWLESVLIEGRVWMLDRWVATSTLQEHFHTRRGSWWAGLFPAVSAHGQVSAPAIGLQLPADAISYDTNEFGGLRDLFQQGREPLL